MTGHKKGKDFVLNPLLGGRRDGCKDPFLAENLHLRYTHITPIFGLQPNGIINPAYPEVTLDNFGVPAVARPAVFWPLQKRSLECPFTMHLDVC